MCVRNVVMVFTCVMYCASSSVTLVAQVLISICLVLYWGLSGIHSSPWPCFPSIVNPVHSIILVALFFNLHAKPPCPAGPHKWRNSSLKIGSVDHKRSSQSAQCSCIHERWKIDFPLSGLHPLLSALFMRSSVCVVCVCENKHTSNSLHTISVCVCNSCTFLMNNGFEQGSSKLLRQTLTLVVSGNGH